jgi:rare lipoprotein A
MPEMALSLNPRVEPSATPEFTCCRGIFVTVLPALILGGCALVVDHDGPGHPTPAQTDDAIPKQEPLSKYGNPESYLVNGKHYYTLKTSSGFRQRGIASWYGKKFHGRRTSSGEIYDMYKMTAAHKELPLPTYVTVKNLDNGKTAVLKVNDRGPFHANRIIDLSYAAALKLGIAEKGTAFVEVNVVTARGSRAGAPVMARASGGSSALLYLQIGAFADPSNARRLSEEVRRYLHSTVRIDAAVRGGEPLYRVQVGPIVGVDLADRIVEALSGLGINDHHFVVN